MQEWGGGGQLPTFKPANALFASRTELRDLPTCQHEETP
jgi:hypothetical protein